MSALKKLLVGAAGLAAVLGAASPAAAQGYPGYPGYGRYQYGNFGFGQTYGYGPRRVPANLAVDQCARAVEARLGGGYNRGYGNGYGDRGYGGGGRVTGIINIEARNNGAVRVHGVASDFGGYNGRSWGTPQYNFSCKVDYAGRVIDLDLDRVRGYRGW